MYMSLTKRHVKKTRGSLRRKKTTKQHKSSKKMHMKRGYKGGNPDDIEIVDRAPVEAMCPTLSSVPASVTSLIRIKFDCADNMKYLYQDGERPAVLINRYLASDDVITTPIYKSLYKREGRAFNIMKKHAIYSIFSGKMPHAFQPFSARFAGFCLKNGDPEYLYFYYEPSDPMNISDMGSQNKSNPLELFPRA